MLCPKNAKGLSRYGSISGATVWTNGRKLVNGLSCMRLPRPGSCSAQSSTHAGKLSGHLWKVHALPPAYGKQNSRMRADGFPFGNTSQREGRAEVPIATVVIIGFGINPRSGCKHKAWARAPG